MHKQPVTLRVSLEVVEIINENRERVALHMRSFSGSRYVTIRNHMPKKHQHQQDMDRFDGDRYRSWAGNIGKDTAFVINTLLTAQHVEETAYRSCMGVMQLAKNYGNDRLEAACSKARAMNSCTYTTVKNILKNVQDKTPALHQAKPTPPHENLRGAGSFE
jgi:hypothetical protein